MYNLLRLFREPTPLFSWVILLIILLFTLAVIYKILVIFFKFREKMNLILLLGSIFFFIIFLESISRLTNIQTTYGEQRLGKYHFVNHGSYSDSFHLHYPNSTFFLGTGVEFQYSRTANSEGLTDINWSRENKANHKIVLCLGDSFTEGDGAPADSTWPILFNNILLEENIKVQVLNAGVCGSDPYFELMLLNEKLLSLNPNIVIFTLSMQDFFEDIAVRGGMERFDPETGTKTKLIEIFYAYSHVVRWILERQGYNWLLVKKSPDLVAELAYKRVPEIMNEFAKSKERNPDVEFFIFLYPHKYDLEIGYNPDIQASLSQEANKYPNLNYFDLTECYLRKIEAAKVPTQSYWWTKDGHHNSKGYYLKGMCIAEVIRPFLSSELPTSSFQN